MNIKRSAPSFLLVALIAFLSGCQEKAHTVSDFEQNSQLLDQVSSKCNVDKLDPASLECRNADTAQQRKAADNAIKQGGGKVSNNAW